MAHQKQHKRRSKKGKVFIAGKGNKKLRREPAIGYSSSNNSGGYFKNEEGAFGCEPQLNELQKRMK